MPWEKKPVGPTPWVLSEGALRHPDGSPDIAAYGRIARRERDAAIVSAVQEATRRVGAIWRVLGRAGRIRSNAPLRG